MKLTRRNNMDIHSYKQLLELVQTIENTSKNFNALLKQENALLTSQNTQDLTALSKQKKENALTLEKQTKTLHAFLHRANVNNGLYGLSDFIPAMPDSAEKQALSSAWLNIQTLSESNKKSNEVNGAMIELNRRHTQRSLDVLQGQVGTTNATYGADGHAMKGKVSRNISIA